jgi:hypothetical protein
VALVAVETVMVSLEQPLELQIILQVKLILAELEDMLLHLHMEVRLELVLEVQVSWS